MFLSVRPIVESRWRDRQCGVPRPCSPTTARSTARAALERFRTSQGNQFGFLLAVEDPRNRRRRALLAAQHRLEALFHPVGLRTR